MVRIIKKTGVLLAAGILVFSPWKNVLAEDGAGENLKENQRKANIQVVSIVGNEMTYFEEETETDSTEEEEPENETDSAAKEEQEGETDSAAKEESENESEGEAESVKSDPASGKFDPSQMGDMEFDPSQMGDMGSDSEQAGDSEFDSEQKKSKAASSAGAENGVDFTTVYLPVAVKVHTDTGDIRTFSILETGDELEVLFEENEEGEEVIIEIWMQGGDSK